VANPEFVRVFEVDSIPAPTEPMLANYCRIAGSPTPSTENKLGWPGAHFNSAVKVNRYD
jgi:hypothetical protein